MAALWPWRCLEAFGAPKLKCPSLAASSKEGLQIWPYDLGDAADGGVTHESVNVHLHLVLVEL
jgi:hypothetical protein